VVSRNQNNGFGKRSAGGSISVQFLVILVPVILGMMGFAVDLGRLYLIRGELNQAAASMALAAAARLNGTAAATDSANAAALATIDPALNNSNRYNFGSVLPGVGTALLTSDAPSLAYFANVADALAVFGQAGAASIGGATARHVTVNLSADAPLLFWSLLSLGQTRKTSIAASAVAGVSAPVCTACGIEPFAIADASGGNDSVNFGFTPGNAYTLAYQCTGAIAAGGPAAAFAGTTRVPYVVINKLDASPVAAQFSSEDDQLFRDAAQGLVPSGTPGLSCSTIAASVNGAAETIWASAAPQACASTTPNPSVEAAMCGLSSRLSDSTPAACANLTNVSSLATAYAQDTDLTSNVDPTAGLDYTTYTGNNRRLLTLPVVDAVATLNVLGFRQFLLIPTAGTSPAANNPGDGDGRFVVLYAGVVAPVQQGRFDGSCALASGPGKVVMHQ
jgi:Flp pilus assembly protein TadG